MSLFEELRRDVGFDADDEAMLVRLAPLMEGQLGEVVDHFYEVIGGNDTMKAVFQDEDQVRRQKTHLAAWLRRTFAGNYGAEYVEGRSRVGKVHVEVGLEQRFMFVMMNVLRTDLIEIARHRGAERGWPNAELHAACLAISRILDLDLAIMLEAYRDSYIQKIKLNERLATLGQMAVTIGADDELTETSTQTARAEALAAIGALTAGLAHEIRNPLNAAKLQLEVLARRARKLDPDAAESILGRVRIVHTEIDRLNSMLNDFLGLARPEEVASHAVSVHDLFDEILQLEEPLCAQSGIQLRVGCESGVEVTGDRHRLKQVFENLVNNARQALEARGGTIWLECEDRGERVRLRVRDDGPGFGMDPDHLAQPFVTTKPAGTGLGLPIVKKIVELHGGRLELSNLPSGGACADVVLPKRLSSRRSTP